MNWQSCYLPPDMSDWQGRPDASSSSYFFQQIKLHTLLNPLPQTKKTLCFALLGFKCDEGVSRNHGRTGAVNGPIEIRKALAKLPFNREAVCCYDMGNMICAGGNLEEAQLALAEVVATLIQHHYIPILLGGGHEIAWGHYQGIAKAFPQAPLGIVNFDSHFDMRKVTHQQGSSGTPFLQIAEYNEKAEKRFSYHCIGIQTISNIKQLFDTAKNYHVQFVLAEDIELNKKNLSDFIQQILIHHEMIYVSLCLDVFGAAFAPGVSAPQPFGLSPWQIIPAIRQLAASGQVVSYDIAELAPRFDIDERTAKLAAGFIYEIVHHQGHTL